MGLAEWGSRLPEGRPPPRDVPGRGNMRNRSYVNGLLLAGLTTFGCGDSSSEKTETVPLGSILSTSRQPDLRPVDWGESEYKNDLRALAAEGRPGASNLFL